MAMIKYFCLMSVVLVAGLFGWAAFERYQWPEDFNQFKAELVSHPPSDSSFRKHINPKYFSNATVIKDQEKLRYPEDIAVANDGTIYTALSDGSIAVINSTGNIEVLLKVNNSGIMLGILLTSDEQTLFVLSESQGLVKVDISSRQYVSLFKEVEERQIVGLNQLCIDEYNQVLYITDAGPISMAYGSKEVLLKHRRGRIFSYTLKTDQLTVLKTGIAFANGIVFEKQKQAVIYSQLNERRLMRFFVSGERKGQTEVVLQNFFGFLDNLKWDENGYLLAGVPVVRNELSTSLDSRPQIRQWMLYIPERLTNALVEKVAGGVRIDVNTGKVVEVMFGAPAKIHFVTTVLEKNGKRYFSSFRTPTILVMDIDKKEPATQAPQPVEEL